MRRVGHTRERVSEVMHSGRFRALAPGLLATAVVLSMMFGLRWFA